MNPFIEPCDGAEEVALGGGRLTAGIVRIGATVRRPGSDASALTKRLLDALASAGFEGAPRYLGVDACGRDVLTYLDGWVPSLWQYFDDPQVAAAARILRAYHDATRGLAGGQQVICHHDPGPNNFVFRNGLPHALIDFDMVAPADAIEDLGYMAWSWCVSSRVDRGPTAKQAAQVRLLADAYGCDVAHRTQLADAILERQLRNAALWNAQRARAGTMFSLEQVEQRITWSLKEHAYTLSHRALFEDALR
jgi:hypothetical protein